MTTDITALPEVQTAVADANQLATLAERYIVSTPEEYSRAGQDLVRCKTAQKKLEEVRTGITGPINASLKKINDFFSRPSVALKQAEGRIRQGMDEYTAAQERIRQEAQRRIDEEARKERERQEKEAAEVRRKAKAEADRIEKEARARREAEEAARREAERAAQKARDAAEAEERAKTEKARKAAAEKREAAELAERNAQARAAKQAEEAGKLEAKAEAKIESSEAKAVALEAQAQAPAVIAPAALPTVAGISTREVWYGECTDLKALARAVADGKVPASFLLPNDKEITAFAKAAKRADTVYGIRVWMEKSTVARTG
jgi:chemotaxis protein histidine kinase CheA